MANLEGPRVISLDNELMIKILRNTHYAIYNTQYVPIHVAKRVITRLEAGNKTLKVSQRVTLLDRLCCLDCCLVRSSPMYTNKTIFGC